VKFGNDSRAIPARILLTFYEPFVTVSANSLVSVWMDTALTFTVDDLLPLLLFELTKQ